MSRKRSADDFRTSAPSLSAVLAEQKGDHAVVTVKEVKEQKFDARGGRPERTALVILTDEYPDNPWFPNSGRNGSVERMFQKFGDDLDKWDGEVIPLVRVRDVYNPQTGERSDTFHAARLDEWEDMIRAAKGGRGPAKKGRR